MGEKYFALIGDIISSRTETDRGAVQMKLKTILNEVNKSFFRAVAADFLITLGDEFQGLLFYEAETKAIFIAAYIIMRMYPVRLRVSVGSGSIETEINRSAAIGADGEAFYRARQGMNLIRKEGKTPCSVIRVVTGSKRTELAVNTILGFCALISGNWTRRQSQIGFMYAENFILNKKLTQKEMAKRFGITQGTVNISLKSSEAFMFARGLRAAQELLDSDESENI